jgi:hypothetical protein
VGSCHGVRVEEGESLALARAEEKWGHGRGVATAAERSAEECQGHLHHPLSPWESSTTREARRKLTDGWEYEFLATPADFQNLLRGHLTDRSQQANCALLRITREMQGPYLNPWVRPWRRPSVCHWTGVGGEAISGNRRAICALKLVSPSML